MGVPGLLHDWVGGDTEVLQGYYRGVTVVLQTFIRVLLG